MYYCTVPHVKYKRVHLEFSAGAAVYKGVWLDEVFHECMECGSLTEVGEVFEDGEDGLAQCEVSVATVDAVPVVKHSDEDGHASVSHRSCRVALYKSSAYNNSKLLYCLTLKTSHAQPRQGQSRAWRFDWLDLTSSASASSEVRTRVRCLRPQWFNTRNKYVITPLLPMIDAFTTVKKQ